MSYLVECLGDPQRDCSPLVTEVGDDSIASNQDAGSEAQHTAWHPHAGKKRICGAYPVDRRDTTMLCTVQSENQKITRFIPADPSNTMTQAGVSA